MRRSAACPRPLRTYATRCESTSLPAHVRDTRRTTPDRAPSADAAGTPAARPQLPPTSAHAPPAPARNARRAPDAWDNRRRYAGRRGTARADAHRRPWDSHQTGPRRHRHPWGGDPGHPGGGRRRRDRAVPARVRRPAGRAPCTPVTPGRRPRGRPHGTDAPRGERARGSGAPHPRPLCHGAVVTRDDGHTTGMTASDPDTSSGGSLAPPTLACHPTPATRSRTLGVRRRRSGRSPARRC